MPTTNRGVFYPDGSWTFPPGLGEPGGAFETLAKSVDTALVQNSLVLLQQVRATTNLSSINFTDIPNTCDDLVIVWGGRKVESTAEYVSLNMRLNSDSTTGGYDGGRAGLRFDTAVWTGGTPEVGGPTFGSYSVLPSGMVGNQGSGGWVHIPRYSLAGFSKDAYGWGTARIGDGSGVGTTPGRRQFQAAGTWHQTSAVNAVSIWPSGMTWAAGAVATLYGTPKVG